MKRGLSLFAFALAAALPGCSFTPDYHPPEMPQQADSFKETGDWVVAAPKDDVPRGDWWSVFNDPALDALERQVTDANQNLKIAVAQYDEARAAASVARAAYFPVITGNANANRQHSSRNVADPRGVNQYNDYTLGADLTYEIDLWGRVRNTVAANTDQAEASAADLAGVILDLHAEMASDYFALRGSDEAIAILDDTVKAYQQAVDITEQRFKGGIAAEADLDQAQTQLHNAEAQAAETRLNRARMEHAIAVLAGQIPANFSLPPDKLAEATPAIAPGLPASLLQRRPDIAAAERRAAAANAEIGVARAAYFPAITLTGALGVESATAGSIFSAPSLFWSLGPGAALTLFDAGRLSSLSDEARANYDAVIANYRQTVLVAYQETEDNLAALHHLGDEERAQFAAQQASDRALKQANSRYTGGATTFLDVVVEQNLALQAHLAAVNTRVRLLTANVGLIRALGGGFTADAVERADNRPVSPSPAQNP